jgi:hypothetical protein
VSDAIGSHDNEFKFGCTFRSVLAQLTTALRDSGDKGGSSKQTHSEPTCSSSQRIALEFVAATGRPEDKAITATPELLI